MTVLQELRKQLQQEFAYLAAITDESNPKMIPVESALLSIGRMTSNLVKLSEMISKEMRELNKPIVKTRSKNG